MKLGNVAMALVCIAIGGCLQGPPDGFPAGTTTMTARLDGTPAPDVEVVMGLDGSATTLNETVVYRVNASMPVAVTLRLNGSVFASETVSGEKTWVVPLDHGQTALNVSVEAAQVRRSENLTLVRLGATTLRIDYCYYHPSSPTARKAHDYTIWIDVDSRPSEPLYRSANATHIDEFTAHDQLYLFEQLTKIPVEVQYFPSFQGFAVNKIDGVGNPVTSSAPPYWLYKVNGSDATGMSLQVIEPADRVVWALSCAG